MISIEKLHAGMTYLLPRPSFSEKGLSLALAWIYSIWAWGSRTRDLNPLPCNIL